MYKGLWVANYYLTGTLVPSERIFSTAGTLSSSVVDQTVFLNKNSKISGDTYEDDD
jgi:hypothetical protein